jgi:hypothetical protein
MDLAPIQSNPESLLICGGVELRINEPDLFDLPYAKNIEPMRPTELRMWTKAIYFEFAMDAYSLQSLNHFEVEYKFWLFWMSPRWLQQWVI